MDRGSAGEDHLDEAFCFVMRSPKSYTCEDLVEFHCHGGRFAVQKVLNLCLAEGARLAEPGEFTRRAFLNGRIDLPQAEAVLDLIRSKSERAFKAASRQLEGSLSKRIREIRDGLAEVLAHVEASIDFPDDEIDSMTTSGIRTALLESGKKINKLIVSSRSGEILREGFKAVLVGKPNAGKSSLMNAILGRDRVIVNPLPGTTRDTVEELKQIQGYPVLLVDTAGLSVNPDEIEKEGIRRTKCQMKESDLLLFVVDGSELFSAEIRDLWVNQNGKPRVLVINKSDCMHEDAGRAYRELGGSNAFVETSCLTSSGIGVLEDRIASVIKDQSCELSDENWIFSIRHTQALQKARGFNQEAIQAFEKDLSPEFGASDIRRAMDALGEVVGEVVTDDILDLIFNQFCIGK